MAETLSFANLITLTWNGNTQGIILSVWKLFQYVVGCHGPADAHDPPLWT